MESTNAGMGTARVPFPAIIDSLTSLRYFAAAWVVFFHCREFFKNSWMHENAFLAAGGFGVDFFFVLSGFVIAHVYLQKVAEGRFDYWSFVTRRVARIYPLHVLMLCTMIAFGVIAHRYGLRFTTWTPAHFYDLPGGQLVREVMVHLTLIEAWGAASGLYFNLPAWSISAEFFAYLLFPVTALAVLSIRSGLIAAIVAIVLFIGMDLATMVLPGPPLTAMTWNIGALRIVPEFFLGVSLYRLGTQWTAGPVKAAIGFSVSLLAIIALIYAKVPAALIVPLFGLVILFAADAERHGGVKWTHHRVPILLGEASYAVYMIHFPVAVAFYDLVIPGQQGAVGLFATGWLVAGLAITTGLSILSHWYFELPARDLMIRLSSLPRAAVPRETAA